MVLLFVYRFVFLSSYSAPPLPKTIAYISRRKVQVTGILKHLEADKRPVIRKPLLPAHPGHIVVLSYRIKIGEVIGMKGITTAEEQAKTGWILGSVASMLSFSIVYWFIKNPSGFIEERIGFSYSLLGDVTMWGLTLLIVAGYVLYTAFALPFVKQHLLSFSWLKWIGIWAAITTGIVEELFFRHLLMDFLLTSGVPGYMQIFISGIAFGAAHGTWILLRGELKIALPVILSTGILGCFLAFLYLYTGRSAFAPIIAHILINMAIEPWLMLAAVSGKWDKKTADA